MFSYNRPRYCRNCGRFSIIKRKDTDIWRCSICGKVAKRKFPFWTAALVGVLIAIWVFAWPRFEQKPSEPLAEPAEVVLVPEIIEEMPAIEPEPEIIVIPEEEEKEEPPPQPVLVGTIQAGLLNVREGPGVNFPRIHQLAEGSVVRIIEERAGWYNVGYLDEEPASGWVAAGYVNALYFTPETGITEPYSEGATATLTQDQKTSIEVLLDLSQAWE